MLLLSLLGVRPAAALAIVPTGPKEIVSAGGLHTCALTPAGAVECWGNNDDGQAANRAGPIHFTVVFSEAVSGFVGDDVTLSGTAGATTVVVSGSGATYNVAVSDMTGDSTVIATVAAAVARDAAGNDNSASTSTDNRVTYDTSITFALYLPIALTMPAGRGRVPGAGGVPEER